MKRSPWRLGFLLLAAAGSAFLCASAAFVGDWQKATFFEIAVVFSWWLANDELTPEERSAKP